VDKIRPGSSPGFGTIRKTGGQLIHRLALFYFQGLLVNTFQKAFRIPPKSEQASMSSCCRGSLTISTIGTVPRVILFILSYTFQKISFPGQSWEVPG
jgi:hypothetical protein